MENFGRFRLVRRFARGGMAEVFLGKQEGPGGFSRELVIKRVLPDLVDDPHFVELFLDEARLAAQLSHPNIVPIFDFGEVDGAYFIAMELVNGPSLRSLARAALKSGKPLSYALLARIGAEIARALSYVHNYQDSEGRALHIVHRDISPSNIVISADGVPKLLDFGVARAAQSLHHTRTGEVKGKLPYMAPEQLSGEDKPDARLDIYALGVVLYEMSCGRRPFNGDNDYALMLRILDEKPAPTLHSFQPNYPEQLEKIILKAIHKDQNKRYQSAQALARDLEAFLFSGGQPVTNFELAEKISSCENMLGESLRPVPPSRSVDKKVSADLAATVPEMPRSTQSIVENSAPEKVALADGSVAANTVISKSKSRRQELGDNAAPDMTGTATMLKKNARPKKIRIALAVLLLLALVAFVGQAYWRALGARKRAEANLVGAAAAQPVQDAAQLADAALAAKATRAVPNKNKPGEEVGAKIKAARVPTKKKKTARSPGLKTRRHKKTTGHTQRVLPPGKLVVRAKPWADIYIDGLKKGTTPLRAISLSAGSHLLEARNPNFAPHKKKIEIRSEQTWTEKIYFKK